MKEEYDPNSELDFLETNDDISQEFNLDDEHRFANLRAEVGNGSALLQAVEVQTEQLAQRQRQITANIQIPYSVEQVWQILTDYEALADFIPNLAKSRRLAHPTGGIRLEQVGTQRLLRFNFSARVVLDIEEKFPHEINFDMVEGDFNSFSGSWRIEPDSPSNKTGSKLWYTVRIWPKRTMPVAIIERRLSNDLRLNLLAIRQRVDELFGTKSGSRE